MLNVCWRPWAISRDFSEIPPCDIFLFVSSRRVAGLKTGVAEINPWSSKKLLMLEDKGNMVGGPSTSSKVLLNAISGSTFMISLPGR